MKNVMTYVQAFLYSHMPSFMLRRNERGATMVEYAILVALISVAAIAIIVILGGQIQAAFQSVSDAIEANTTGGTTGGTTTTTTGG